MKNFVFVHFQRNKDGVHCSEIIGADFLPNVGDTIFLDGYQAEITERKFEYHTAVATKVHLTAEVIAEIEMTLRLPR